MMAEEKAFKDLLREDAIRILQKRLDRLKARKFVLFPFLRRMMLARKYARLVKRLGA